MSETGFDLRIERLIDAPLAAVWTAWTEHPSDWFCPRPWRAEVIAHDLRPGGRSAIVMHGPAGERHEVEGLFLEVTPRQRIVSTDALGPGWMPRDPFMVRIDEFVAKGTATRYTATARHWSEEARERHRAMGFEGGWAAVADQLAEVARRLA